MKNKDVLDNIPRKVYKLYNLIGEVVYVGQTTDLIRRLGEHAFNYIFDTVTYQNVECKEDALNLESYLISKFNPKGNKQLTKRRVGLGSKFANIEEIVFIDSYEKLATYYTIYLEILPTSQIIVLLVNILKVVLIMMVICFTKVCLLLN